MSNDAFEVRVQHFVALKSKYQATRYEDSSPSSLLYLILRKADLELEITDFEWNWLLKQELLETIEAIKQEPQRKAEEPRKLDAEFSQLKSKFKVTRHRDLRLSSPLYPILWKLDSENQLTDLEVKYLQEQGLTETVAIVQEMAGFAALKAKYQATQYRDSSLDSPLYQILKQLDARERLSDVETNWLLNNQLVDTLEIFWQQEAVREADFAQLKDKYQATKYLDSSVSSPLYQILKNLDTDKQLNLSDINWLEEHQLSETVGIVLEMEEKRHFAELKVKYKATEYEDLSPSSHLFKVLKKIDSVSQLGEQDINFLKKRKLTETITVAVEKYAASLKSKITSGEQLTEADIDWLKQNGREDVITFAHQKHFIALKAKYRFIDWSNTIPFATLYDIMLKLERGERLDRLMVAQLIVNEQLSPHGKIAITHHTLEAKFYEQEYKRTGNQWNLVSASSDWRKADEPQQALQLTNLNFNKVSDPDLKSALLTNRGRAFRDIEELSEAENCALAAIECQPDRHEPYILMATICDRLEDYERGIFYKNEAIKRGAELGDIDYELKRVVKNTKDENKRQEVVEYLLKTDPHRYAWANSYLKKPKN
jgi:hypothetical protein